MFEKKNNNNIPSKDPLDSFRPAKGSSKVVIGNGVKIKGEITDADEVQIDGSADVQMNTDNLVVGSTGQVKGTITSNNIDVWGNLEGDVNATGTLSVQELGVVSGNIEYQNLQIKLGGKIRGDIKVTDKVKKISEANKSSNTSLQDSTKENLSK
mgnify:CR=1 FL=1